MFEAPRHLEPAAAETGDAAPRPSPLAQMDLGGIWSLARRGKMTILSSTAASLLLVIAVRRRGAASLHGDDPNSHRPDRSARGRQRTQPAQSDERCAARRRGAAFTLAAGFCARRTRDALPMIYRNSGSISDF